MADTLFYTADSIFFLCIAIAGIYLFVFALAALFRRSEKYPATGNMHRFILLVPPGTEICKQKYPEELYTLLTYENLYQSIKNWDDSLYDIALILGETTNVSPCLLKEINNAYGSGQWLCNYTISLNAVLPERFAGKQSMKKSEIQYSDKDMSRQDFLRHSKKQILP